MPLEQLYKWKVTDKKTLFQFDRVCRLFSEDPTTTQSDEFFGTFDYFITSFEEARQDNESVKRKKEEEEKIAKQHQEVSQIRIWMRNKRNIQTISIWSEEEYRKFVIKLQFSLVNVSISLVLALVLWFYIDNLTILKF